MRTADGTDVAPTAMEQATGSGHHREAVLVFPAVTAPGSVWIVVKNVGGVAERTFVGVALTGTRRRGAMAQDPVCGMTVDEKKAPATAVYQGKTYFFCSAGCKAKFDKAPAQYAKG